MPKLTFLGAAQTVAQISRNNADDERRALDLDEYAAGYPRMTLSMLLDVAHALVQLDIVGVEDLFPQLVAQGAQFGLAVAQLRA